MIFSRGYVKNFVIPYFIISNMAYSFHERAIWVLRRCANGTSGCRSGSD